MPIDVKVLGRDDSNLLNSVAPEVFDDPIDAVRAAEFLRDPRHHLLVAVDAGLIVGFATGIDYLHPDKPRPELWINEIGVSPAHRHRGIGRRLLEVLLDEGRRAGCTEAWVLADPKNAAAIQLYSGIPGTKRPAPHSMFTFPLGEADTAP